MPKDKEEKVAEAKETSSDQDDRVDATQKEADEVEGHVSAADVWAPGATSNKWKRRR